MSGINVTSVYTPLETRYKMLIFTTLNQCMISSEGNPSTIDERHSDVILNSAIQNRWVYKTSCIESNVIFVPHPIGKKKRKVICLRSGGCGGPRDLSILGSISGFWVLHLAAASFLLKEGKNIFPLTSMMHRLSFENIPCQ